MAIQPERKRLLTPSEKTEAAGLSKRSLYASVLLMNEGTTRPVATRQMERGMYSGDTVYGLKYVDR